MTGIDNPLAQFGLTAYPNPFSNKTNVIHFISERGESNDGFV